MWFWQADVCDNPQPADSLPKVVTKANTTKAKLPEEDPLLSPASDLRVTRKVGQDGLVIAWLPSTDSQCVGYLVNPILGKIRYLIMLIGCFKNSDLR